MYAARLATALKQRLNVAIFGMGGPQMRAAGVEIITDYSEVPSSESPKCSSACHRYSAPCAVSLTSGAAPSSRDSDRLPVFHLRLARKLRPQGIRNVYYICPQFWAWCPWRVNLVRRRFARRLLSLRRKFYADAGVPVKSRHPLVGNVTPRSPGNICKK